MNNRAIEFARSWDERFYGFWPEEEIITGKPFSFEDHVDPTWRPDDLERLLSYLNTAPVAVAGQTPMQECKRCGELISTSTYRTDDVWLWPDNLAHVVARHDFVLPERLVEHIRSKDYLPPRASNVPIENLPWPQLLPG